ncbi:MAG: DUF177 domain-containing protein [Balneolaceae bacterium]
MIDSKLTFKIQEIPDGQSHREIVLGDDELEVGELNITSATVGIDFLKTSYFIKVDFSVEAGVWLRCDRSLEEFEQSVTGRFQVIFQPDADETDLESETDRCIVKPFNVHELTLSIDSEVRDTILLELPSRNLHPKFYDSDGKLLEFETRTFGEGRKNREDSIDPRWEALKKLN